jgi:hypothetical protein
MCVGEKRVLKIPAHLGNAMSDYGSLLFCIHLFHMIWN